MACLKLMALVEVMPGWLRYCTKFVAKCLASVTFLFIVGRRALVFGLIDQMKVDGRRVTIQGDRSVRFGLNYRVHERRCSSSSMFCGNGF
ncbi:hypothetical protein [Laspinema olomoucense]|uniref:hypothetical protein n=1 Tax=Laspinema olomoucense TaxID=3231600 RepID=UPI0021BAEC2F|nr:hypothetical protein [Laspinema sp. D3d]